MALPIAVQLYSLREALARDFTGTVKAVAAAGFAGVETAGFPGTTPQAAAALFRDLGLTVCGAHMPLPVGERQAEVVETMQALNCQRVVCGWLPAERFKTPEDIAGVRAELNAASAAAQAHGLRLGYHNHWFEFEPVAGRLAFDYLQEGLAPEVFFELDVYWIQTAGADPVEVVRAAGGRAPLLHLKDGPAVHGQPMTALGQGRVDLRGVVQASAGQAEWLVVELDTCATDMLTAVQDSYTYLVEQGLGHGTR